MAITRTPIKLTINTGNITWTNMPLAATELFGNVHRRTKVDLTDVDKCRLLVRVSTQGSTNAILTCQYSLDETNWSTLCPTVAINTTGTKAGNWDLIPVEAKADVFIRIIGSGGDGAADPILGNIGLEIK